MPSFIDEPRPSSEQEKTPWTELLAKNASTGDVLYYFSSDTCKFCDLISPWVDAVEKKYAANGLTVLGINIQRSPAIASAAAVTGVPVLIMTQKGEPINRLVGWSKDMATEIESSLGLTDLYNVQAGLVGPDQGNVIESEHNPAPKDTTCVDCEKPENGAIAELAANLSIEIETIKSELSQIKSILLDRGES